MRRRRLAQRDANPQRKLDRSRHPVSIATFDKSKLGAVPAALPATTWKAAKNAENMTMSERRNIQNPKETMTLLEAGPPSPRPGAAHSAPSERLSCPR